MLDPISPSDGKCNVNTVFGHTSRWGLLARPPVETGVCHAKPAEARLPNGEIAGLAVRLTYSSSAATPEPDQARTVRSA